MKSNRMMYLVVQLQSKQKALLRSNDRHEAAASLPQSETKQHCVTAGPHQVGFCAQTKPHAPDFASQDRKQSAGVCLCGQKLLITWQLCSPAIHSDHRSVLKTSHLYLFSAVWNTTKSLGVLEGKQTVATGREQLATGSVGPLLTGSTGSGGMRLASTSKTENVSPTTFQVIFEGASLSRHCLMVVYQTDI